jgi:hypothetical protein
MIQKFLVSTHTNNMSKFASQSPSKDSSRVMGFRHHRQIGHISFEALYQLEIVSESFALFQRSRGKCIDPMRERGAIPWH